MNLEIDPALLATAASAAIERLFQTSDWRNRIADSFGVEIAGAFKDSLRRLAVHLAVDPELIRVAHEQARLAFLAGVCKGAEAEGVKAGGVIAKAMGKLAQAKLIAEGI